MGVLLLLILDLQATSANTKYTSMPGSSLLLQLRAPPLRGRDTSRLLMIVSKIGAEWAILSVHSGPTNLL